MTFSLCVREGYRNEAGEEHTRYGVAVTTRLPAVGILCPFANKHGAVATQSLINIELGRKGIEYLADGVEIADALQALLNADDGRAERQLHGVDAEDTFVFSGKECRDWYGHQEGDRYTVAGNLLTGESVVEAVAETYEANREEGTPLAKRLIEALAAGQAEGGDKRADLPIQSAALIATTDEEQELEPYYNDLRVDATESPIADLRETYRLADQGWQDALERYEDEMDEE